eukprot:CAMPEP_0116878628 /NCGR_PEP_ID=MMETSP0463-20121206/10366_1 /TAXON_ID=181622 /ORGANISM="Strombidinopsis sp, Strain SopsisLIS2011" /LENGTH=36 /DNA_ID= /DNA_START= /DNA_END= /DNA_ORIENTATION=
MMHKQFYDPDVDDDDDDDEGENYFEEEDGADVDQSF